MQRINPTATRGAALLLIGLLYACGGSSTDGGPLPDGGLDAKSDAPFKGGTGGVVQGGAGGAMGGDGGFVGGGTGGFIGGGTGGSSGGIGGGGSGGMGAGGAGYACNADPLTSAPGSCEPDDPSSLCQVCLKQNCCTELANCLSTSPSGNNACGFGTTAGSSTPEYLCFQDCVSTETQGGASLQDANNTCGARCVSSGCGTISPETSDLFSCVEASCLSECF